MKTHGIPERFWVVTRPSPASGMEDICFSCTVEGLMRQARGGLQEDEIVAIFADETEARRAAGRLLGKYPVRPQDAMCAEVLVHVMVTPRNEDMTARELAEAAVEAVANAVRDAERRGHQHRLEGQVTLGMSEVFELHNSSRRSARL
jgi:pantothenate synthetase